MIKKIIVVIQAKTSAITIENQIPFKPKIRGRTKIVTIWKTKVLKKEIRAEINPLFKLVKNPLPKIFIPAKELIDKSHSVIYLSSFELFDTLAKSKFGKDEAANQMNEHIFDCDLLIIDDLGTELTNSFTVSQLFLCLNERLLRRKSTIISTNLSLESLVDIYSERTFSRITSNYTMLKLTGDDIRIKKKLMKREGN